jgi:hypothetical protein
MWSQPCRMPRMSATRKAIEELNRLMEPEGQDDPKPSAPPQLSNVLYSPPVPGGARRNCLNCTIMDRVEPISGRHVCGHHLFGAPSKIKGEFPGLAPVDPKYSGLILAKDGVACENCEHFSSLEDEDGVCAAVLKKKKPAHVHPKGRCNMWTPVLVPTDPKAD